MKSVKDRLLEFRHITADGHWIWLGHTSYGYGYISIGGKEVRVHRLALQIFGDIEVSDNDLVLHRPPCIRKDCFNPEHLYVGDRHQNMQDMVEMKLGQVGKIHCPKGHPYDEKNTYTNLNYNLGIHRQCRICTNEAGRRYRERRRSAR